MSKPSTRLKIAAALFAVGAAVWMVCHFSQPSYGGKRLSSWLDKADHEGQVWDYWTGGCLEPDPEIARAIRAIGPRAVPLLLTLLRAKDTPFTKKLRDLSQTYKWIPIDCRDPEQFHSLACYGFWLLGPLAKSAVPQLIASLDDKDAQVRASAAFVLSLIGPAEIAALPALEKRLSLLCQTNPPSRDWETETFCVFRALGEIGPPARSAILKIVVPSQPRTFAIPAAKAARIKITGEGLDSAIAPLANLPDFQKWREACEVAEELGANAAPAVPLLVANLQSTNRAVQVAVLTALGRIHSRPDLCLPAMTRFLWPSTAGYVTSPSQAFHLSAPLPPNGSQLRESRRI
jgi:hypothetical protein